jgi:hypothetical protein
MSAWRAWARRPLNILERTERLLRAKAIERPLWFDAVRKYPPDPPARWQPRPKVTKFLEDELLTRYFRKNPAQRAEQVFNLFDQRQRPPAVVFVARQMELMNKEGLSEQAAYARVMAEMQGAKPVTTAADASSATPDAESMSKQDPETVNLTNEFEAWMKSEDRFWRRYAELQEEKALQKAARMGIARKK